MKSATTGAISGCVVWILAFGFISACILPVSMAIGGFTSASDYAINFTGKFICPDGTTPESYSYATTTRDENGNEQPSTAYELHCVAANGEVLKSDPVGYSFLWIGIFVVIGLVLTTNIPIHRKEYPTGSLFKTSPRSEEHTSELQSLTNLVCRLLLESKNNTFILSTLNQPVSSFMALNLRKTLLMASSVRLKPLNCSRLPCVYAQETLTFLLTQKKSCVKNYLQKKSCNVHS